MTADLSHAARLLARGVLACIEGLASFVAGAVDTKPDRDVAQTGHPTDSSRKRTSAGGVEPVAYDDEGRRVGGSTGTPIRGEW